MLVVDPMKRITIPDIRQHQWFKIHLPRYLVVPLPDAMQHLKKLDENILQQVIRMGFDEDQLLESLQNKIQDYATVAYYLLYDNRSSASSGYIGAEFQESMDGYSPGLFPKLDPQMSTGNGISQDARLRHPFSKEKKWLVGLQSPANPQEITNQVLGTLQELNVRWKKIGHYNMTCLWCHATARTHLYPQTAVKFEMQLYKTQDEKYLLDLQRISGPQFLFLDFCAAFIMQLESPQ